MAPRQSQAGTAAAITSAIERLRVALSVDEPEWYPADTFKLESNWERLGCKSYEQRREALRAVAKQLNVDAWDPPQPPGLGVERTIKDRPVFQFVLECSHFRRSIFFRFAFNKDGCLFIVSIHPADFAKKPNTGPVTK